MGNKNEHTSYMEPAESQLKRFAFDDVIRSFFQGFPDRRVKDFQEKGFKYSKSTIIKVARSADRSTNALTIRLEIV